MANEGLLMVALGGLALFALFRKPGGAPGAPTNGGQIASLYGGGSLDDFAADATIRADEAAGVGKGYLLEPVPGFQTKAPGALDAVLTSVPTLGIGALGDYVEIPLDIPPEVVTADEDIGVAPAGSGALDDFIRKYSGALDDFIKSGGNNSDSRPTIVELPSSAVPVIDQEVVGVQVAADIPPAPIITGTTEQPGSSTMVIAPEVDTIVGSGSLDDFVKPVYRGSLGDFDPIDTFPTLVQVGTSDNAWVDAHIQDSIQRITNLRRAQGQAAPSAAYKERMASEIRAANIDLPVYR